MAGIFPGYPQIVRVGFFNITLRPARPDRNTGENKPERCADARTAQAVRSVSRRREALKCLPVASEQPPAGREGRRATISRPVSGPGCFAILRVGLTKSRAKSLTIPSEGGATPQGHGVERRKKERRLRCQNVQCLILFPALRRWLCWNAVEGLRRRSANPSSPDRAQSRS